MLEIVIFLTLISWILYRTLLSSSTNSAVDLLPGPTSLFERWEGIQAALNRKSHVYFMKYAKKFKIFKIRIFLPTPSVVVVDKDAAKLILTNQQLFARPDMLQKITEGILDNALFVFGLVSCY